MQLQKELEATTTVKNFVQQMKEHPRTYSTKSEDDLKLLWVLLCYKKHTNDTEIIKKWLLCRDMEEI